MGIYAVVDKEGTIVNTVVWDGESTWSPPEGTEAVDCGDNACQIGGTYINGIFTPPAAPEVSKEESVSQAEQQKASLLSDASQKISILQDAVDLEMATDDETAQLTAWKKYRVLLNRVDTSTAPDVSWPTQPS